MMQTAQRTIGWATRRSSEDTASPSDRSRHWPSVPGAPEIGTLGEKPEPSLGDGRNPVAGRADRVDSHVGAAIAQVEDAPGGELGGSSCASSDPSDDVTCRDGCHLVGHVAGLWEVDRDRGVLDRRRGDGHPDGVDVIRDLETVGGIDGDKPFGLESPGLRRTAWAPARGGMTIDSTEGIGPAPSTSTASAVIFVTAVETR